MSSKPQTGNQTSNNNINTTATYTKTPSFLESPTAHNNHGVRQQQQHGGLRNNNGSVASSSMLPKRPYSSAQGSTQSGSVANGSRQNGRLKSHNSGRGRIQVRLWCVFLAQMIIIAATLSGIIAAFVVTNNAAVSLTVNESVQNNLGQLYAEIWGYIRPLPRVADRANAQRMANRGGTCVTLGINTSILENNATAITAGAYDTNAKIQQFRQNFLSDLSLNALMFDFINYMYYIEVVPDGVTAGSSVTNHTYLYSENSPMVCCASIIDLASSTITTQFMTHDNAVYWHACPTFPCDPENPVNDAGSGTIDLSKEAYVIAARGLMKGHVGARYEDAIGPSGKPAMSSRTASQGTWLRPTIYHDQVLGTTLSASYIIPYAFDPQTDHMTGCIGVDVSLTWFQNVLLASRNTPETVISVVDMPSAIVVSTTDAAVPTIYDMEADDMWFIDRLPSAATRRTIYDAAKAMNVKLGFGVGGSNISAVFASDVSLFRRAASYILPMRSSLVLEDNGLVLSARLMREDTLMWLLVVSTPQSYYYGTSKRVSNIIIGVSVALAVMLCFISVLVWRGVTQPLELMTHYMVRVAQLEFSHEDKLVDKDETGTDTNEEGGGANGDENDNNGDGQKLVVAGLDPFGGAPKRAREAPLVAPRLHELTQMHVAFRDMRRAIQSFTQYVPIEVVRGLMRGAGGDVNNMNNTTTGSNGGSGEGIGIGQRSQGSRRMSTTGASASDVGQRYLRPLSSVHNTSNTHNNTNNHGSSNAHRAVGTNGRIAHKYCTMLFADIAGFTSMCEQIDTAALASLSRLYFERMSVLVVAYGGTIDKYIGDCIMAIWGAPVDTKDGNFLAAACGVRMVQEANLNPLKDMFQSHAGKPLSIRVGIHSGLVLAGNIGCSLRLSYTVLGDAVNTASRLEGLNKQFGTQLMVSEEVASRIGDAFVLRKLSRVAVAGKSESMEVFEVMGVDAEMVRKAECNFENGIFVSLNVNNKGGTSTGGARAASFLAVDDSLSPDLIKINGSLMPATPQTSSSCQQFQRNYPNGNINLERSQSDAISIINAGVYEQALTATNEDGNENNNTNNAVEYLINVEGTQNLAMSATDVTSGTTIPLATLEKDKREWETAMSAMIRQQYQNACEKKKTPLVPHQVFVPSRGGLVPASVYLNDIIQHKAFLPSLEKKEFAYAYSLAVSQWEGGRNKECRALLHALKNNHYTDPDFIRQFEVSIHQLIEVCKRDDGQSTNSSQFYGNAGETMLVPGQNSAFVIPSPALNPATAKVYFATK